MKTLIYAVLAMAIFTASSCSKNNSTPSNNTSNLPANTWTFKGVTYSTNTVTGYPSTGRLTGTSPSPQGDINFNFYAVLPTSSGDYKVAYDGNPQANDQVGLYIDAGYSNIYYSSGGNGNQLVHVSVNGGKVTVSGSGLQFFSSSNHADSSAVSFNITQTQ